MSLRDWVQVGRRLGASDLHLEGGGALMARVGGELRPHGEPITGTALLEAARELLAGEAWDQFLARGSADVSVVVANTRCRFNLYRTLRGVALAVRLLVPMIRDLKGCNLHPDLRRLVEASSGLAVVSGPTGSGKSTTLAALIEELNASRARHIISLESPIEYLFANRRSMIRQREIPTHSPSFEQAIIDALRENPDVLVISEMRTPEVIRLTLNAAETGHLVLATMHSASCAEALSRICMAFAAEIQSGIRAQLADCLVGVVCQRLEYLETHALRVPRCEVLLASSGARGAVRAGAFSQLANVIQAGGEDGMWSVDRYQRWIDQQTDWVRPAAPSPEERADTSMPPQIRAPGPGGGTAPRPAARPVAPQPARTSNLPPTDQPIEIAIDEDADLSELAKRIERRTR